MLYLLTMKNTTDLVRRPSFLKGVARVVDLFGKIDEYKYSNDPDSELLERDWTNTGNCLEKEIKKYGREISSCSSC